MIATLANAHAEGLIREIEDEGAKERHAIAEAAEREAAAIVRRALADVRRRVHDEIGALRREIERRLARAEKLFPLSAVLAHSGLPSAIVELPEILRRLS
jgi:F0F1-type ATP synthase membrane subunit b/b'